MNETAIVELIRTIGTWDRLTYAGVILYLGYRRVWVWGPQLKEMTIDRDYWRDLALRLLNVTEKTVREGPVTQQQQQIAEKDG